MKAVVCLMFACVLTAATAQAQAPAAQGGQKIPLSEGLRRSYNTLEDESHRNRAEIRRGRLQLPSVAGHPRLRRATGARRQLAVQRVFGGQGRAQPPSGSEPRADEDDEGRHHQGARRFVRVLRSGVCEPDRPKRARARAPGPERGLARRCAHEPDRPRQRGIRDSDGLHANQRAWSRRPPNAACADGARRPQSRTCGSRFFVLGT